MSNESRSVNIVAAGVDDLGRVHSLAHEIWPEAYTGILPPDRIPGMLAEIYAPAALRADIEVHGHSYWLATVDGVDAGFGSAYRAGDRVWIKKLYVKRDIRGLGLGRRLMEAAIAAFDGANSVALYVNDGNVPAIGFYTAQGFGIEDRVPVRMGPYDFTDYIMSRALR